MARHAAAAGHEVIAHGGRRDGDLLDAIAAAESVRSARPDGVIHAAGATHGLPAALWRDNVLMTVRLLDAVREYAPHAHVILLGSAAEYGFGIPGERLSEQADCQPNSEYGMSKLAMTRIAAGLDQPRITVARLFNVVTPDHEPRSLLGRVAAGYAAGEEEPRGAGEVRDFVRVDQVARIVVALTVNADAPAVVNVCTGAALTAAEFLGRPRPATLGAWAVGDPTLLRSIVGDT